MYLYTYFLLFNVVMTVVSKNIDIKSGLDLPIPSSVGLRFFTEIKNNNNEDCSVEVYSDECCLEKNDSKCDIVKLMGSANEVISGGATKTLTMVAPLLDPYERKGYCSFFIDSRPLSRPKDVVRDAVKIKFNTRLKKGNVPENAKICQHIDQDPLNNCEPVNCDTYYNGKKSYFSVLKKRCLAVPTCISSNIKAAIAAYNPKLNKCVYKPTITEDDIDFIRELTRAGTGRVAKDISSETNITNTLDVSDIPKPETQTESDIVSMSDTTVESFKDKKSKAKAMVNTEETKPISEDDVEVEATPATKVVSDSKHRAKVTINKTCRKSLSINNIIQYISNNKYTIIILAGIVLMQCFLICTMIYCMTKTCCCCKRKHVEKKFFNHRQDASVTTPLIGTSNIDTETTDYQYMSESSNYIDKKIKCYKACQKERKNNMKLSMSDDILSKCITRRDWHRLPRSETIQEVKNDEEVHAKGVREMFNVQKKATDVKVNFQEECKDKMENAIKSIGKHESENSEDRLSNSSEREILCHSYNYDTNSNITGFKKSSHRNIFGVYNNQYKNQENKKSNSIEKGAQTYFSNDSLDDFLSERGVIFIGDNASKYSFSSASSEAKSLAATPSSKTSKNNIVKNVITLLSKKVKGPSSDPGVKQSKPDLDLELLHISRASMFSSSNDTDNGKDIKMNKDSTSSL